jgi:hypothetical protein
LYWIPPSYRLSPPPLPSYWYQPPPLDRIRSTLLFTDFVEEKQKTQHFCLFEIKVATQGVSLWYFHVYMYHNPNWFISSILHSTLSSFHMVVSVL